MSEQIRIGKNVIETLTMGMYRDPFNIYREYVQNAADAIDKAVKNGIYQNINEGNIFINIDTEKRQIIIEDEGTGIESNKVLKTLGSIAESQKDRTREKGFRGIGRLGGLGYCERLTFETSYKGETVKSIMVWDSKKLREILFNHEYTLEAAQVISVITNFNAEKEKSDVHYFRVILDGVRNDELLDKKVVRNYLSMVAPAAFPPGFIFKSIIYEELKKDNLFIDEYNLSINSEPLFKPYKTHVKRAKIDYGIDGIEFHKEYNNDGKLLFWCWYGYSGQMSKEIEDDCIFRGLRLRKYNIQIGKEDCLNEYFGQERGNTYFIGEVHTFNPELIPTSQRDFFEDNELLKLFKNRIKFFFHDLYRLYQNVAVVNTLENQKRKYDNLVDELKKHQNKNTSNEEIIILSNKIEEVKKSVEKHSKLVENLAKKSEPESAIAKIISSKNALEKKQFNTKSINEITEKIIDKSPVHRVDKLTWLENKQRKVVRIVFDELDKYDVLPPNKKEELKQKIETALKQGKK